MRNAWWNEDNNPLAPKFLGYYIDKIEFNKFLDVAEVWMTEKLNVWKSKDSKNSWSENEFPGKVIWKKEADGKWYLDYGIGIMATPKKE